MTRVYQGKVEASGYFTVILKGRSKERDAWLQVCFLKSTRIWFESVLTLIYSHRTRIVKKLNVLSQCSGSRLLRKTQWVQIYRQSKKKRKSSVILGPEIRGHSIEVQSENEYKYTATI